MKWTDVFAIARQLAETYPGIDPISIGHADMKSWILRFNSFGDAPERCTRNALEAIQYAWIEECGCLAY